MPAAKQLSKTVIEALRPAAARYEQPDAQEPGLYLVVQPSGRKSWAVRYRFDGKPRKLTLDHCLPTDVATARKRAREAKDTARAGEDPAFAKQETKREKVRAREADVDTFAGVARLFLFRYAQPKNRDWREQARLLGLKPDPEKPDCREDPRTFIAAPGAPAAILSQRPVRALRSRDVRAVVEAIVDRGSPISGNRTLAVLQKLFIWAAARDDIEISTNLAVGVDKQDESSRKRSRILTDEEIRLLWSACDQIGSPFGPIVKLLLLTGQRRDEVGGITRSEVSADGRVWTLPAIRAKNKIEHQIPLAPAAAELLKVQRPAVEGEAGLIFTTTGTTPVSGFSRAKAAIDEKMLAGLVDEITKRGEDTSGAIVPSWRLHDLRRTAATGMARLGINLPVIEKVLNHASGSFAGIVGVYQHHDFAREKRVALERWAVEVGRIVSGKSASVTRIVRRA